ncbi:MAG: response regulator transcription factor [Sulfuricurvum sp.]|nr:response regulator transcription factor [Sulfuricurvum sp.]
MFTSSKLTVLCIENDVELREKYSDLMHNNGLNVLKTDNMATGCDLFRTHKVDIILVDLELPNHDGLEFIRCLRDKEIQTPTIVATSSTDKSILLEAINLEITRYLVKPFLDSELLESLHVASKKLPNGHCTTFTALHDGFSYDPINKSINNHSGELIQLSKKEYLLIELLLKNKRQIIPYEEIERIIWQDNSMSIDALRTLVRGIRKKTYSHIISNHNGIGYKTDL